MTGSATAKVAESDETIAPAAKYVDSQGRRIPSPPQSQGNACFRWITIAAVARAEAARPTQPKAERHALPINIFRRHIYSGRSCGCLDYGQRLLIGVW